MAPIDPAQLLKALDSLLSIDGGIKSIEDVPRLASLMKKFSKKLVSRCVYCNVLQATKPEILSEYLDKGGWETINTWLQYAKSSSSESFLLEMLKLCKLLPMTLNRLKENNTAKLIKSLTKHENDDVKEISNFLVNKWMSIIKEKKNVEPSGEKKKKKDKSEEKKDKIEEKKEKVEEKKGKVDEKKVKPSKAEKTESKSEKVESTKEVKSPTRLHSESAKGPSRLRNLKRTSVDKESKPAEIYEDVKIDPEPLMPVAKKARPDRPKTVKIFQKKFRATGLEEETPLPKNLPKKTATVDKSAVAAAKSAIKLNTSPVDRITEKKIKPESLMAVNESANTKGIKLIPAKPRPTYVLHESASFIDALISQPVAPIKRKKKTPPKPATTAAPQPTSPTMAPPKFQFYKDTLEEKMSESKVEESKTEDSEKKEIEINEPGPSSANNSSNTEEVTPMEVTEEGGHTPPNEEIVAGQSPDESEFRDEARPKVPFDPNNLKSILSHCKRRTRKKKVRWVDDSNIKEIFYFEMDDTERVNVSRNQNFYDLKSIEMRREREAMELAKRQSAERVQEFRRWWDVPIRVDLPFPLMEPGNNSTEKHSEHARQEATLAEIYFTKDMIPDAPREPDLEIVAPKEPKIIPLDEDNMICALNDFSGYERPCLPDILTTLIKLNVPPSSQIAQNMEPVQVNMETGSIQQSMIKMDVLNQPNMLIPPNSMHMPPNNVHMPPNNVHMPPNNVHMPPNNVHMSPNNVHMSPNNVHISPNNVHMPPNNMLLPPNNVHIPPNQPGPEPLLGAPNGLLPHISAPYQSPPPDMRGPEMPGEWQGPPQPPPDMSPNDFYQNFQPMNQNIASNNPPPPRMNSRGGPPGGNNYRQPFRAPPRGMAPSGRNRIVCRHFSAGHCRFGMNCQFLHPGVNGPHL